MQVRDKVEKHIIWNVHKGETNFWWDNWTTKRTLALLIPTQSRAANNTVHDYIIEGTWKYEKLADILGMDIVL